jgi:hypothetical protein
MSIHDHTSAQSRNDQDTWTAQYLPAGQVQKEKGLFAWWYRLTAPPVPSASASLQKREVARRGRLTSLVLFFMGLLVVVATPVQILQNPTTAFPLLALVVALAISLLFNRKGRINIAGGIVVVLLTVGLSLLLTILQPGNALSSNSVAFYDIMIEIELFAVSLLPPEMVFVAAVYNTIFVLLNYNLMAHTNDLKQLIAIAGPDVVVRPIGMYFMVALITYLWVRSSAKAIERADRAEQVALLEHAISEQAQAIAAQKQQLDQSIQYIVQTHMRVANGELDARVPLTEENVLWVVGGSLNNLLTRFQQARQAEIKLAELQNHWQWANEIEHEVRSMREVQTRMIGEVKKQVALLRDAQQRHVPFIYTETKTFLDPLLAEISQNQRPTHKLHPISMSGIAAEPTSYYPGQEQSQGRDVSLGGITGDMTKPDPQYPHLGQQSQRPYSSGMPWDQPVSFPQQGQSMRPVSFPQQGQSQGMRPVSFPQQGQSQSMRPVSHTGIPTEPAAQSDPSLPQRPRKKDGQN